MGAAPANAMSLMRIWVIKDGELLPSQSDERLMRTGMLAKELVVRGHDVTWWATTFSHQHKMLVRDRGGDIVIGPRYRLRLLHAGAYRRNVSATRYLHHWRAGVEFRRQALFPAPPDEVAVSVTDGVVTLSGSMRDRSLLAVAARLVRAVEGVVDVTFDVTGTVPARTGQPEATGQER